jgi:hypothetical protein
MNPARSKKVIKMLFTPQAYIGIDPSRGGKAVSYAALDQDLTPVAQGKGSLKEVFAFLSSLQQAVVGVVGPSALNQNIMVDPNRRTALLVPLSRGRPGDMRVAEYLLKQRGLPVYRTPSEEEKLPGWMAASIELNQKLAQLGFEPHEGATAEGNQRLEVIPEVCFQAWITGEILPQNSTFGRLQRQLTLYDMGLNIRDPMTLFQEITRHKVLHGQIPEGMIYSTAQIQCLAAAFLAWQAKNEPRKVAGEGVNGEGFISFPAELVDQE